MEKARCQVSTTHPVSAIAATHTGHWSAATAEAQLLPDHNVLSWRQQAKMFIQHQYWPIAKMMISYDGWCRAARQGCLPTGNYGSASRPEPTILWPYSCQTQPYSPNHTLALLIPYSCQTQPASHTLLSRPWYQLVIHTKLTRDPMAQE